MRWLAGIAVVIAVFIAVAIFFPWNALRGPVADYASHRLKRMVRIDGDLNIHLALTPRIDVHDVTIGNAPWSDVQPMARLAHASFRINLLSLLRSEASIPDVELVEPTAILERNADGNANWVFDGGDGGAGPHIGAIRIQNGRVRFRDPNLRLDLTADVSSVAQPDDPRGALRVAGSGTYRGERFSIDGTGLGLSALRNVDQPYQLKLHAKSGVTEVRFDGTIVPARPQNIDGQLVLQGKDLAHLHPIVPVTLPWTPPYKLAGVLTHQDARWRLTKIEGTIGKSDVSGEFALDLSRPRRAVFADLISTRMHYEDLGGFVGLPPGDASKRARSPAQREAESAREASSRSLPTKRYDVEGLRTFDADVKFRGKNVTWSRFPVDNLSARMLMKDGVITLDPLDFGIADGHVVSKFHLDVRSAPPKARGQAELRNIELKRLFPQLASPRGTAGRFGGYAKFDSQGDNVAALLGSGNAEGAVIMRGGEASTLALVLTNLDLARAATLLMKGDETSEVSCAVSAFTIRDGIATPQFMVIDTSAEKITTTGSISFKDERYDLHFKAQSKKASPLALRGPIVVAGTFKQPTVRPEIAPLAARIGAAVGLGAISPPLALLALVDLGGASDADCRALMSEAQLAANAAKEPAPSKRAGAEAAQPR